jgi:hypothetical protein
MSAWIAFWLFLAIMYIVDAWLYSKGHDTFFFRHKTPEEKEIQQQIIRKMKEKNDE